MATLGPVATAFTNSSDANFRLWADFISDVFAAAGWVQTSDTGQINLTTVTAPGATNTKRGYQIWRMDDTLQATAPVYLRIDYGSSSGAATQPGIWLTIGTGSDGAGAITGTIFNGTSTTAPTITSAGDTTSRNNYGSGSTNRVMVALHTMAGSAGTSFGIERTKDSSGNDTATGLLIWMQHSSSIAFTFPAAWSTAATFNNTHQNVLMYMPFSGTQPPTITGLAYILANANPSVFGSDVGFGVPVPLATIAKQPGINIAMCRTSDVLLEASVAVTAYGASVTYLRTALQPRIANSGSNTTDTTAQLLFRFD
jgi:hypothetical protein